MDRRIRVDRLTEGDTQQARELFLTMAQIFEAADAEPLTDAYLGTLLVREDFWALAAFVDGELAGGLTAHTLPLTRREVSEVFIYDIAVLPKHQRRGVGRALVAALRALAADAGISVVFVPADNEDTHALDFYRAIGGEPAPVTIFTFDSDTILR